MKTLVVGLALALAVPFVFGTTTAAPTPSTTYELLVSTIEGTFGFIPETAIVNGVEMPSEQALAFFKYNSAPLGSGDNIYNWDLDQGVGHRFGTGGFAGECLVGAVSTSVSITAGPADPLANRETQGVPNPTDGGPTGGSTILCGAVIPYVIGEVGAEPGPGALFSSTCVNLGPVGLTGGWVGAGLGVPCYFGGYSAVNIVGHVGHLLSSFCFFGICINTGQLFGGVGNWGPAPVGSGASQNDFAVVGLQA